MTNRVWRALDADDSGYAGEVQWFRFITSIAAGDSCGMENQNDALEQIAFAVRDPCLSSSPFRFVVMGGGCSGFKGVP